MFVPIFGNNSFLLLLATLGTVKLIPSKDFEHLTFKADIAKVDQGRWIIAAPPQHCSGKRWGKNMFQPGVRTYLLGIWMS